MRLSRLPARFSLKCTFQPTRSAVCVANNPSNAQDGKYPAENQASKVVLRGLIFPSHLA